MGIYFHHVFSCIGVGGFHKGEKNLINHLLRGRINEIPQVQVVALKWFMRPFRSEYLFCDFSGSRAREADNTNPCLTNGCGYGSNGIFVFVIPHKTKVK